MFLSQIINNYLDEMQGEAVDKVSPSGMHFRDSKRKVDYVLAYHYRKRPTRHPPGAASPEPTHGPVSLALVSNGRTRKGRAEPQRQDAGQRALQEQPAPPAAEVIELSPLDALEEEKRLQREEFERNLVEAGLEIEKDPEVRGGDLLLGASTGNGHFGVGGGYVRDVTVAGPCWWGSLVVTGCSEHGCLLSLLVGRP